jgi:rhamnulose-1-phosphate aldolase
MVCGTNDIGIATAKKLEDTRLCVWTTHGIYGTGRDLDEAFGLIETVEKAAELYMLTVGQERKNEIKDNEPRDLAAVFGLNYNTEYLD